MKRSELEHVICAAGSIADDAEIVVIGSQSILGQFPSASPALLVSAAADLFPLHRPELADLIDGSIGEGSPFHELYGYYSQGLVSGPPFCPEAGVIVWYGSRIPIPEVSRGCAWKYMIWLSPSMLRVEKRIWHSPANWRCTA